MTSQPAHSSHLEETMTCNTYSMRVMGDVRKSPAAFLMCTQPFGGTRREGRVRWGQRWSPQDAGTVCSGPWEAGNKQNTICWVTSTFPQHVTFSSSCLFLSVRPYKIVSYVLFSSHSGKCLKASMRGGDSPMPATQSAPSDCQPFPLLRILQIFSVYR
ncbi:hypothetical protein E2C01_058420 [Portunus trituberculatus]|uniref:Uncharacterized protein n=1 Tax=Portunus trituberculatus TaxID=210409 RepID=A0A5B7H5B0_PORTR|nr:hypothetical protein [Portunus trituberculatus]